jgi:hypothetical protein
LVRFPEGKPWYFGGWSPCWLISSISHSWTRVWVCATNWIYRANPKIRIDPKQTIIVFPSADVLEPHYDQLNEALLLMEADIFRFWTHPKTQWIYLSFNSWFKSPSLDDWVPAVWE